MNKVYYLILSFVLTQTSFAQLSVTINGKKVSANQEFSYSDIKTMTVCFTNPFKLPTYSDGYVLLSCGFFDESGIKENVKYVSKKIEGAASINAFLNQKLPKEYQLLPSKSDAEFKGYIYNGEYNFASYCEKYKTNPFGGKVKLKFELAFYELTGWHYGSDNYTKFNEYGDAVELLDPFEISLKIADKNALLNVSTLNTKFSINDMQEFGYEKFDTTGNWNNVGDVSGNNSTKPKQTIFNFKENNYVYCMNLKYPMSNGEENLKDFMSKCDQTAFLYANKCIKLNYFVSEAKRKKMYEEQDVINKWGLKDVIKTSDDRTLRNFNEKLNENGKNETIWKSFSVGNLTGYKALNLYKSNTCYDKNNETGRTVIYAFVHPNDASSILVFICDDYKLVEANFLDNKSAFVEKFISKLKF